MSHLLEMENVRIRFRSKNRVRALLDRDKDPYIDAVCGVSLNIGVGETFAIVGESGAGKTTLARSIIGLVSPQEGSIRFEGNELLGLSDTDFKVHRREIAMMFQDPVGCLSPRLTVRSLITEPFKIHGLKDRDLDFEAARLLDMVGLPATFAGYYPYQLSGGQARRVGVARALALSPKLIIADEPTAGLDVSVQGEVLNLMARLQKEMGISFMVITHNLAVVRHTSDRMAIMYLGRFLETGLTDEIFANPRHPYTHALLSATPDPDPDAPKTHVELEGEIPSLMNRPSGCEFHTRCPFVEDRCRTRFPDLKTVGPEHDLHCYAPIAKLDHRVAKP
jgi:oligopeptide/dipeptide ABC transporter ATP-binding protein